MRDPGAVMSVGSLSFLVGADLIHGHLIPLHISLVRNIGGHATHRVHFAMMARLNQQLAIAAHEMSRHGYAPAVGENVIGIVGELLDEAENIIPASGVQPRRM